MKKIASIAFSLTVVMCAAAVAQQRVMDTIVGNFMSYRNAVLHEKIFLHVDRRTYLTGETMWFKAYAVYAQTNRASAISTVAYVEILNDANTPVLQSKIALQQGRGNGSLFLPASLSSGCYTVRAYTRWMKNFPAEYFFHRTITVVNPFIKPTFSEPSAGGKPEVAFFPEGGHLVAGLRSKVAFRATGTDGKGVDVTGAVLAGRDTVAVFRALKFGIGHFYFTPLEGVQYSAVVRTGAGSGHAFPLPTVERSGVIMTLIDSAAGHISIRVSRRGDPQQGEPVYVHLLAHRQHSLVHAEGRPLLPDQTEFRVDRAKIGDGITHFTVFDSEMKPLCERLYFKAPARKLALGVAASRDQLITRRKVTLDITAAIDGAPARGDFSVAVFRQDSLAAHGDPAIDSYFGLASDLRGRVESPGYYLSGSDSSVRAADNLMLTHGWRRFSWDDVNGRKTVVKYLPEYRNHLVTATATKPDGSPAVGVLTYLSSPGKLVNLYGGRTDERGEVSFEMNDFLGVRKIILQNNTTVDSTLQLSVNNPFSEAYAGRGKARFSLPPSFEKELTDRSIAMQVQDIYYREDNERIRGSKPDSTAFYGIPDETYYLDQFTRFPVMEEVMREYVPGVLVRKRRDGFHFVVLDVVNKGVLAGDPMVLVDGVPVFDVDQIMAFSPLRVRKLEVVTRNFYSAAVHMPGIVSYSTYQSDLGGFPLDPRAVVLDYEGLQHQREYYSPRYDTPRQRSSRLPDQRVLLCWRPDVRTDEQGRASVDFFTSDLEGRFRVEVQGMTPDGYGGAAETSFVVQREDY